MESRPGKKKLQDFCRKEALSASKENERFQEIRKPGLEEISKGETSIATLASSIQYHKIESVRNRGFLCTTSTSPQKLSIESLAS